MNIYILLFCVYFNNVLSQNEPIAVVPQPETPINGNNKPSVTLWQIIEPWRGIAMICFWAIIIGICASVIITKYCLKHGRPLSRILKRGKYSNYNFVSVYSETEAEFAAQNFGGLTDNDDFDTDKLGHDPVFDEISIIK